ncbi:MAG: PucR family transcriptional regulator [Sphaerochaetaceae bacterium]
MLKRMTVSYLASQLSDFPCSIIQEKDPTLPVESCVLLEETTSLMGRIISDDPEILCICKVSQLINFRQMPGPIQLAIICDSPLDPFISEQSANILSFPAETNETSLYREISSHLRQYHSLCRWNIMLNTMLVENKDLQKIVDVACNFLQNPLIVQDRSFHLLCYSKVYVVDEWLFKEITDAKFTPYAIIKHLRTTTFTKVYNSRYPVLIPKDEQIPNDTLAPRIDIQGKPVGHVSLIAFAKPFGKDDQAYMKVLSEVISQWLQRNDALKYTKSFRYESFFANLLDGRRMDTSLLENEMKMLDISFDGDIQILTVKDRFKSRPNTPLYYIRDRISQSFHQVKSVIYKNSVAFIISHAKDVPIIQGNLHQKIKSIMTENKMVCGISRPFADIARLPEFYKQSLVAIDIGLSLDDAQNKSIFFYEDCCIYHALDLLAEKLPYDMFCIPDVLGLLEYDTKNNTNYLASLYIYLINGCNVKRAAEVLNIHRNTMAYRIECIVGKLSCDLNDTDVAFAIQLSVRILIRSKIWEIPDCLTFREKQIHEKE